MARTSRVTSKAPSKKATSKAPWTKSNPRKRAGKAAKHLSPTEKSAAKARAKRAGRHYPNLVDNMRMAAKKATKTKTSGKKHAAKKSSAKSSAKASASSARRKTAKPKAARKRAPAKQTTAKSRSSKSRSTTTSAHKAAHPPEKDPHGGLTPAGRKAFAARDGAHLKPGVTKKASDMTPQEMRRKGSWALRFYGRKTMPALVDAAGHPTRHALSAHAWGEPVPRTVAAARRIADKGERLLARYHRLKEKR